MRLTRTRAFANGNVSVWVRPGRGAVLPAHDAGGLDQVQALLPLTLVLSGVVALLARQEPGPSPADAFTVQDVMIPMRDGVKLHTKIFTPREPAGPLPIIFMRTPYGIEGAAGTLRRAIYKALADEGYIFVFQDIRGKFESEGAVRDAAAAARSPATRKASTKAPTPTTPSTGCSRTSRTTTAASACSACRYDGWTTIMGALEPHPALKAISPQASPADMWLGDDFHHNGAFRLSYGFEYAAMMESGKDVQAVRVRPLRHLRLVPRARAARERQPRSTCTGRFPTWNDYVAHPDYDEFWKRQTMVPHLTR